MLIPLIKKIINELIKNLINTKTIKRVLIISFLLNTAMPKGMTEINIIESVKTAAEQVIKNKKTLKYLTVIISPVKVTNKVIETIIIKTEKKVETGSPVKRKSKKKDEGMPDYKIINIYSTSKKEEIIKKKEKTGKTTKGVVSKETIYEKKISINIYNKRREVIEIEKKVYFILARSNLGIEAGIINNIIEKEIKKKPEFGIIQKSGFFY